MKKIVLLSLITLTILSCGIIKNSNSKVMLSEKRIFGEMKIETDSLEKNLNINEWYSIYISKNDKSEKWSKKKLLYDGINPKFDITLSKKDINKYKFIFFLSYTSCLKIIPIEKIQNNFQVIELEKVRLKEVTIEALKPAIYLYPINKQKISIIHDFKGEILNTYPRYNNGWEVIAFPNGKLINTFDNREYNYLFWDGKYNFPKEHIEYKNGFYVNNLELIDFLRDKLSEIGLNNAEINDFTVFWLPILNRNKLNFIHFRINDNIDNISFLNVEPKPDTEIRVFMEFKGIKEINKKDKLPEQKLKSIERKGFTLIEWGGAIIGNEKIE